MLCTSGLLMVLKHVTGNNCSILACSQQMVSLELNYTPYQNVLCRYNHKSLKRLEESDHVQFACFTVSDEPVTNNHARDDLQK